MLYIVYTAQTEYDIMCNPVIKRRTSKFNTWDWLGRFHFTKPQRSIILNP